MSEKMAAVWPTQITDAGPDLERAMANGADMSLEEMASKLGVSVPFMIIVSAVWAVLEKGMEITLSPDSLVFPNARKAN